MTEFGPTWVVMERKMGSWKVWIAGMLVAASTVAVAQTVVEKPANRFYGTARPPGAPAPAPSGPPAAAPPMVAPPAAIAPPAHRPGPPPVTTYHRPPPPRVGVDVVIGTPYPTPYYAPRPYYGPRPYYPAYPGYPVYPYPPAVVVPPPAWVPPPVLVSPPPVYVERPQEPDAAAQAAAPASGFWYWCADPQGWYPEVRECGQGWQAVPPRVSQ